MIAVAGRVGLVTVTFNSGRVIDGFMRSLVAQDYRDYILYVIDNASVDDSLERLNHYPDSRIRVISNPDNRGVAEGNNQGIRLALRDQCDYVLLINNDTEFGPGLIAGLLTSAGRRQADLLVPKIMFFEPNNVIWCAGGEFRPFVGFSTLHCGEGDTDRGQFEVARTVTYAPTCCMLVRSTVFERIGTMDAKYFVYYDDTDFCWRAKREGIALWYEPGLVLFHKVSSLTGGSESDFSRRFATRNKVYFASKHFGYPLLTYCLFIYQLIFLTKLMIGKDSWATYKLKQRSFVEGLKMHFSPAKFVD